MTFVFNKHLITIRHILGIAFTLAAALILVGCGNGNETGGANQESRVDNEAAGNAKETKAEASATPLPKTMKAFQDDGSVLEITIEGDDQMRYDTKQFSVSPGQMVRLTLNHVGSLPVSAMGHNVVIIEQGEDYMEFTADANEQGANLKNDYLPEAVYDRVIAFTEMVGGGETTTVEFKAPEETGKYPYLCTFPGHAAQMNGTMTVKDQ